MRATQDFQTTSSQTFAHLPPPTPLAHSASLLSHYYHAGTNPDGEWAPSLGSGTGSVSQTAQRWTPPIQFAPSLAMPDRRMPLDAPKDVYSHGLYAPSAQLPMSLAPSVGENLGSTTALGATATHSTKKVAALDHSSAKSALPQPAHYSTSYQATDDVNRRVKRAKREESPEESWTDGSASSSSATSTPPPSTSPSPPAQTSPIAAITNSTRVRRSAAVAARAIKAEMSDAYEPGLGYDDDDDADAMPGSGSNRKRKRGEQQKAKHNVAEKRRRIEMNDAMDRIKACLSQGGTDSQGQPRGAPTKVSILLDTADHLEGLQRENERLKQQVQALTTRVHVLEQEVTHYRGESEDTTSLVSSPGGNDQSSPRSRGAILVTSSTLLTILFCYAWSPASQLLQSNLPDTVSLTRTLMGTWIDSTEPTTIQFMLGLLFLLVRFFASAVMPTLSFFVSLLITLYIYSVIMRPIIRDKDLIAAHLETVTAIHGTRVHSNHAAWVKAIKLSTQLGSKPPSPVLSILHIFYELLRCLALHLWFGVFLERAIYILRGITPDTLDKNAELEVSLTQCLVELCPDADWSIAAVTLRALNLCMVSPNKRFTRGVSVAPLYKVKLWAFGATRLRTHFSWPYRLLAWYCTSMINQVSSNKEQKAPISAENANLVVDFPASVIRAKRRDSNNKLSPESVLGKSADESSESADASITAAANSQPTYVVSEEDDANLFNVRMPEVAQETQDTMVDGAGERRMVETTYRSVCLVHEIAGHMLAGRMDSADASLAEMIDIRSQNLPIVSRVSLDSLHTAHLLPFTRWGTLRTQLLRAMVQGIQGKHEEAVRTALLVRAEAESCGDVETRCASVLSAAHLLINAGQVESAAQQLSSLLQDPQAVARMVSDAGQNLVLRAMWILLEANDPLRDRTVGGVDFVVDERFFVELKHFVTSLEARRDHRFETLYHLTCVVEALLNVWQQFDQAIAREAANSIQATTVAIGSPPKPAIVAGAVAMQLDRRASMFLNLKLLTRRALTLLGSAASTGSFFVPAYHFFNAKHMMLTQGHSYAVEKALSRTRSSALKHGKWSREAIDNRINDLLSGRYVAIPIQVALNVPSEVVAAQKVAAEPLDSKHSSPVLVSASC